MAWIEQRRRADGGVTARVFWRPSGCRDAPGDWETFSAGSDAQNLARADGFKRMVDAAGQRWPDGWVKGEGSVRPPDVADPMTPPPSFDKIGEEYVRQIVLSPGQRKRYLSQLQVLARTPVRGSLIFAGPVTAIGESQLKTWLIEWGRSLKTKANYHGLIYGVFAYAAKHGYLAANPAIGTAPKQSRVKQSRPGLRFLTELELETAVRVRGAVAGGYGDDAARFYAAEAAKVIQAFFHAAALTGRTLDHVLRWVANPSIASEPTEILREHPHAAPYWHGLLQGALQGDDRTAGNTTTTVQQAMSLFFQDDIRRRCVPGRSRPATDVAGLIRRGGTIYLLGREDPYASASPLMTAVAEHVLDTALLLAGRGRLCPPMLACLDELPSTAPLPTLRTRMANERAFGISFIYAAQTWRQRAAVFGEQQARALLGLTNVLVMFGGSKDGAFNQEISDLVGQTRVSRSNW